MKIYLSVILKNVQALLDPRNFPFLFKELVRYFRDVRRFKRIYTGSYPVRILPIMFERTSKRSFDPHYVYQAYWTMKRISGAESLNLHVDVSSHIQFVAQLSAVFPVIQLEYRPNRLNLPGCITLSGNISNLPFPSQSLRSVSCLHVVEHIGLGRYGDPLEKNGCWKALSELQRVIAPGGNLFLSVPVGNPAVYFNAHYVFRAVDIRRAFPELELSEFSFVDDNGNLRERGDMKATRAMNYALGLFHFKRAAA